MDPSHHIIPPLGVSRPGDSDSGLLRRLRDRGPRRLVSPRLRLAPNAAVALGRARLCHQDAWTGQQRDACGAFAQWPRRIEPVAAWRRLLRPAAGAVPRVPRGGGAACRTRYLMFACTIWSLVGSTRLAAVPVPESACSALRAVAAAAEPADRIAVWAAGAPSQTLAHKTLDQFRSRVQKFRNAPKLNTR